MASQAAQPIAPADLFIYEEAARFPDQLVNGTLDSFQIPLKGHVVANRENVTAAKSL
jgi:hypothetical protein